MSVVSACPLPPTPWTAKAFWSKVIVSIRLGESHELLLLRILGFSVSEVSSPSGFVSCASFNISSISLSTSSLFISVCGNQQNKIILGSIFETYSKG